MTDRSTGGRSLGRSIRVTGHHSVFVEGPGGEPVPRVAAELRVGATEREDYQYNRTR